MALINGIYVFIDEDGERVEQEYELSSHPVEDGEAVADHLRPQPFVIKLQGEVVGPDAAQKLAKLRQLAATATPGDLCRAELRQKHAYYQVRHGAPRQCDGGAHL